MQFQNKNKKFKNNNCIISGSSPRPSKNKKYYHKKYEKINKKSLVI